jgi:hypothetical protein
MVGLSRSAGPDPTADRRSPGNRSLEYFQSQFPFYPSKRNEMFFERNIPDVSFKTKITVPQELIMACFNRSARTAKGNPCYPILVSR